MEAAMKRLFPTLMALMLAAPAFAQGLPIPLLKGPYDPGAGLQTFNTLIVQLNNVLVPSLGSSTNSSGGALVNQVSLTGGSTGNSATIGLQPGADPNAGISLNPNGSGNIQFFGVGDTGVLQFGNSASFVTATGFAACPGVNPGRAPIGVQGVITSYIIVKDWLGKSHGWATC
jgi:hypothetical protein